MYWTVPSDTPLQYHDQLLQGELSYLEDAMGGMQLWGIVNNERREMGETDSKQTVYLIKFMPVFQKISARFFIIWGIIGVVLWWLINKFELWQYMDGLIEFIKGLAN